MKAVTLQKSRQKYFWFLKSSHFKCFSFSITITILISIIVIRQLYPIYRFFFKFLFVSLFLFICLFCLYSFVRKFNCFHVSSLLTNVIFRQFKSLYQISNCAVFMLYEDGLTIRNIWKRLGAFVFAVLLLFCYYVLHELTQRRSEKKNQALMISSVKSLVLTS